MINVLPSKKRKVKPKLALVVRPHASGDLVMVPATYRHHITASQKRILLPTKLVQVPMVPVNGGWTVQSVHKMEHDCC